MNELHPALNVRALMSKVRHSVAQKSTALGGTPVRPQNSQH
jgi:hypothetical protein